jgi:hypothetical protein
MHVLDRRRTSSPQGAGGNERAAPSTVPPDVCLGTVNGAAFWIGSASHAAARGRIHGLSPCPGFRLLLGEVVGIPDVPPGDLCGPFPITVWGIRPIASTPPASTGSAFTRGRRS